VRSSSQGHLTPETQRLVISLRLVTALLCMGVVLHGPAEVSLGTAAALLGYTLWATLRLWRATSPGMPQTVSAIDSLIDVWWGVLMLRTTPGAESMLLVTLVQPFVMSALVFGTRQALLLGACAAVAVLFDGPVWSTATAVQPLPTQGSALAVALLAVCSTVLTRPVAALHQRRARLQRLATDIDPRRGLDATMAQIARTLHQMSGAPILALTLPTAGGGSTWFSTDAEGDFAASPPTHRQIERLLADLPVQVLSNMPRSLCARLIGRATGHASSPSTSDGRVQHLLTDLGRLLQVGHLTAIPLQHDGHCRGHALLGWNTPTVDDDHTEALVEAAPELLRLLDTASLVDQLQDEAAGHERARIGRDLHDSAIQPYLGLKFAVESVARRAEADSPLRRDLDELAQLVNSEITTLREVISVLRTGSTQGDNALVPAVRRLVRRFSQLFGVEVQLDCAATLNTSRALAGMLFQLISEALNNVRKHTSARRVWVRIERSADALHLHIRDNAGSRQGRRLPDFVPASLIERVAELGGTMTIDHADGFDTELHLTIPDQP
jgi:signal transduction histidine kinase